MVILCCQNVCFTLPDTTQRQTLLEHFCRKKQIKQSDIDTLASVTYGYSPQQLITFINKFASQTINSNELMVKFNTCASKLSENVTDTTSCATVTMSSFVNVTNSFPSLSNLTNVCLTSLREAGPSHQPILLYGTDSTDKITAARELAHVSSRTFIHVQAGGDDTIENALLKPTNQAIQLGRTALFFSNIDRIAATNMEMAKQLQLHLERFKKHDILFIGSTQEKNRIDPGVLGLFTTQIECSRRNFATKSISLHS